MKATHTADITLIGLNGSLGIVTANFEVTGTKKLDGPSYLDEILKSAYEAVHGEEVEISDCRCSVSGIYSGGRYHHFDCQVTVQGTEKQAPNNSLRLTDHVVVYVDRKSFKEV